MKKIFLTCIYILIPLIIAELLLYSPFLYHKVLSLSSPIEWSAGYMKPNYWPDMLIMGSSLVRGGINPQLVHDELAKKDSNYTIGDIAVPSDSLSNDYFTLKRILATCVQCPKKIVVGTTDIALREKELAGWVPLSEGRLKQTYMYDDESESVLAQAARVDPAYADIKKKIDSEKVLRLYFLRFNINKIIKDTLNPKQSYGNVLIKTQNVGDPGYGYWPYIQKLSEVGTENGIKNYRSYLGEYRVGGSGGFFLEELIKICKENDIQIVVVLTPFSNAYLTSFNKEVRLYRKYVHKVTDTYEVPVIDSIDLMPSNYDLYSDMNHLNKFGADIYSKYLAKELYEKWNDNGINQNNSFIKMYYLEEYRRFLQCIH